MRRVAYALALATIVAGCATKSADVAPTYTSASAYAGMTCRQIAAEREEIAGEVSRVSHAQDEQRRKDQIATGVGLVVFWPALIYNAAVGDEGENLGRLKGQMEAIDRAGQDAGCR